MRPLIDISALSSCFKEYGPHPLHYVYRLLQPVAPSAYSLLGNAVNNMFDAIVSLHSANNDYSQQSIESGNVKTESYADTFQRVIQESWHNDALLYLDVDDEQLNRIYFNTIRDQFDHVCKVVDHEFPLQKIDSSKAWLEPSFVCPELGLSGRMDLLDITEEEAKIVELKSGKMNEWQGHAKLAHRVQTMLYAEVLHKTMGIGKDKIRSFLHYNTYPLLEYQIFPEELSESALSMRDKIEIILHEIAIGNGQKYFTRKAVEDMYSGEYSKLWTNYDKPQLLDLVSTIEDATPELKTWFFSRLQFILKEEELKYLQPEAVSLRGLPLIDLGFNSANEIERVTFSLCSSPIPSDFSNSNEHDFRAGDPVLIYPLWTKNTSASDGIVLRGNIEGLTDAAISVTLRHTERLCHFKELLDTHQPFTLEHDTINSNISQACRSVFCTLKEGGPTLGNCRLIVGPPGTGKTSVTLRNLVHQLYHTTNQRILLLAFTHRAVDEICETLEAECPYVRLGTPTDTPDAYKARLLQWIIDNSHKRVELRQQIEKQRLWTGTTARLLAMPHLFDLLDFDTIIVDEASQLLDHQVIEILKHAKKECILIGDPKQLPAVTLQEGAQSLFEQLYRDYQKEGKLDCVTLLDKQGRMHPEIAKFSNRMFYGDQLSSVGLPHQKEASSIMPRYAFIDVPSESLGAKSNQAEAMMVARLVKRIAEIYQGQHIEWTEKTLGIIVPYRQQIAAIRTILSEELANDSSLSTSHPSLINIDTVERYQGSQRDIIIYSTTISTSEQLALLSSPLELDGQLIDRKLNVAITRARKHLFIVGNRQLLNQSPIYKELLSAFSDKK